MDGEEIYLDHAASTPLRPEARAAWLAASDVHHANPTGAHRAARAARRALDDARDLLAETLLRAPAEVVFTSGGSEADNLAVRGVLAQRRGIAVCSAGEHHAVLEPVVHAGGLTVGLERDGRVAPERLREVLSEANDVSIVSIMAVNNETGAINDLAALAAVVRECAPGAVTHTDAVQALRWIDLADAAAEVDLVSITGHKIGGPVGTGALFVRAGVVLDPLLLGGGQERGRRAGTPDVAGAAAFAAAATVTVATRVDEVNRLAGLRDRLMAGLVDQLATIAEPTVLTEPDAPVVAGIGHVMLHGVEAEALLFLLDAQGLRASAASSCSSGAQDPSHVLASMGIDRQIAQGSLRLSLGHTSTEDDIDRALAIIPAAVRQLLDHGGG